MKLHLPKALCVALLAAVCSTAWAITDVSEDATWTSTSEPGDMLPNGDGYGITIHNRDTDLVIDSGSFTTTGHVEVKNNSTMTLNDGASLTANKLMVHNHNSGNWSNDIVTINAGSTLTLTNSDASGGAATSCAITLGHWGNGKGTLNVAGGTLDASQGIMRVSWDGAGEFNLTAGTAKLKGIEFPGARGNSGAINVSGGSLLIGSAGIKDANDGQHRTLTLSGGTVGTLDGNWTIHHLSMAVNGAATLDTTSAATGQGAEITLSDANTTGSGSLTIAGNGVVKTLTGMTLGHTGGTTVNTGATLQLNGTALASAIENNGTLVLNGATDLSNMTATSETSSYGETLATATANGNGYMFGSKIYTVSTGSGNVQLGEGATFVSGDFTGSYSDGTATLTKGNAGGLYYINTADSLSYTADSVAASADTTGLVVNTATTITMGEGTKLKHADVTYNADATVQGAGNYVVNGIANLTNNNIGTMLGSHLTLSGSDLMLTISGGSFSGVNLDNAKLGSGTLEIKGITGGHIENWNSSTNELQRNIKLSNSDDGQHAAWVWTNGSSSDATTMTFAGTWSGQGNFLKETSDKKQGFEWKGDISGWTGQLRANSGVETALKFTGKAKDINVSEIRNDGNGVMTITLAADEDMTVAHAVNKGGSAGAVNVVAGANVLFSAAVNANSLTINADKSVTMAQGQTIASVDMAAGSSLNITGGLESTGITMAAGSSLTMSGHLAAKGASSLSSISVGSMNFLKDTNNSAYTVSLSGTNRINGELDMSGGSTIKSTLLVTSGASLAHTAGNLWISHNAGGILLEKDATFTKGAMTVKGLSSAEDSRGSITWTKESADGIYTMGNENGLISKAKVTVNLDSNQTVSNSLQDVQLVTTGSKTLTLNNNATLTALETAGALTINANKTVSVSGEATLGGTIANNGSLSLNGATNVVTANMAPVSYSNESSVAAGTNGFTTGQETYLVNTGNAITFGAGSTLTINNTAATYNFVAGQGGYITTAAGTTSHYVVQDGSTISAVDGAKAYTVTNGSTLQLGTTTTAIVSGDGTVEAAMAAGNRFTLTGGEAGDSFSGVLTVNAGSSTNHGNSVQLSDFSGTLKLAGRFDINQTVSGLGGTQKLVLLGDRDNGSTDLNSNNTTGFWGSGAATIGAAVAVEGEHYVDLFASNSMTFSKEVSGDKLRTCNGNSITFNGQVNLAEMKVTDNTITFNKATTIGTLAVTTDKVMTVNDSLTISGGAATTITNLTLGEGATVTLGSEEDHANALTVTGTLTAHAGTTVNADLVMGINSTLALNGSVTMGCSVTLTEGMTLNLTLVNGEDPTRDLLVLFTDVESATLGAYVGTADVWYDASEVFGSITIDGEVVSASDYLVGQWGGNILMANVNSAHAPEPATATLSLLALAGLCARRRRK